MTSAFDGAIYMPARQQPVEANVELYKLEVLSAGLSRSMQPGDRSQDHDEDQEQQDMIEDNAGNVSDNDDDDADASLLQRDDAQKFLAEQADQGQNFTIRGVLVGLAIGVIICFSNMYFGLQTGWVSGMAMPAALIGFGFFKTIARCIDYPFTPVENVLVQTVAGALGYVHFGANLLCLITNLGHVPTNYAHFWGFPLVLCQTLGRKTKYSSKRLRLLPKLFH